MAAFPRGRRNLFCACRTAAPEEGAATPSGFRLYGSRDVSPVARPYVAGAGSARGGGAARALSRGGGRKPISSGELINENESHGHRGSGACAGRRLAGATST